MKVEKYNWSITIEIHTGLKFNTLACHTTSVASNFKS